MFFFFFFFFFFFIGPLFDDTKHDVIIHKFSNKTPSGVMAKEAQLVDFYNACGS